MDNQYTSYYLYKKYQVIGGELIDLGITSIDADGTMPLVIKNEYDPACGYIPPTPECKCSAYTYSFTSATVSSAATSITLSYTGCSKLDLTSAATYNWIAVGNQAYNTGTSVGNVIANISANTSSSRSAAFYLSLDGTGCNTIYISQQSGATPTFDGKFKLTLNDSSIVSAECDSTSSVTSGEVASQYSGTVISAEIGQCVTDIDSSAFIACRSLTSVTIGNCVTTIGNNAFLGCWSLTTINIPNSVTSIGQSAFGSCRGLTTINIPNSITSIGQSAFGSCRGLTTINIPNSVTSIGNYAFGGCSGLISITIPNSVTSIGDGVFNGCWSLTTINIPNSVTSIGQYAFNSCSGLTSIVIPDSVINIGNVTFNACISLTSITCLAITPPTLGNDAFFNTNNCPIYVPSASVNTYKSASGWSSYSSRIQAIP